MPVTLIVDGYNLTNARPDLFGAGADLEQSRDDLLSLLARYKKKKGMSVTVVFDGANAPGHEARRTSEKGISVIYSRLGQSADSVIRDLCRTLREKALVVSSDRALCRDAAGFGAACVDSDEFLDRAMESIYADMAPPEEGDEPSRRDKKGPAHREKKARRRHGRALEKL
ncbi:MAG: NYN domain-containing protein [Thermodesulfobacteriota bacterium]